MKSILISIKPKYVAKILNGKKTIEVRKSTPKCELPIDVYIYCTKDKKDYLYYDKDFGDYITLSQDFGKLNGKVVAKFTLNKVEEIICRPICGEWECYTKSLGYSGISQASFLKNREIVSYLKGKIGYAWHIDNLVIFDKPKELNEFKVSKIINATCNLTYLKAMHTVVKKPLTKAPQSWCYVESEEKE